MKTRIMINYIILSSKHELKHRHYSNDGPTRLAGTCNVLPVSTVASGDDELASVTLAEVIDSLVAVVDVFIAPTVGL